MSDDRAGGEGTTAVTGAPVPPKRIPVNGRPIRLRWLQQIIWLILAANVGAFIISALYYLFVELRWHIGGHTFLYLKPDWDHLFTFRGWAADRHDVRDVYEAVLATLFVRSLLANWRRNPRRGPSWYVVLSPILIVVVAFPIVVAGIWLINYALPHLWHEILAHHTLHNPVHVPAGFDWFGTYPAGNTVQLYFIGRSVDKTRDAIAAGEEKPYRHLPRWPWPPVIRERAAWIMSSDQPVPNRTRDISLAVQILTVLFAALAIYGAYVRYVVEKGHLGRYQLIVPEVVSGV